MLGVSAGLEQKTINDFKVPEDYISYLYTGIKGWICKGQITTEYRQSMYRFNGLMKQNFDGDNVYISMNTFCINKRTVDQLKRLNALYVDIDCYKLGLDKANILETLEDDYFDTIIPVPTFVVDSGRGLYLIWKLRNEDRNALPRWTRVQEYLIETLKSFGADSACKDAARILRIPFSRNSKSNTKVEILQFHDVTYSITQIQKEYNIFEKHHNRADGEKIHPYNTATEPMRRYATQLAAKLGVELPNLEDFSETKKWIADMLKKSGLKQSNRENKKICYILQGYCTDIETLFTMRKGTDCKREIALFLYRLFNYYITGNKDLALERTLALNASFSCPLPKNYVIRATKSAESKIDKGSMYHYKRKTIIQILEITNQEMESLVYLVGDVRRKERKKENNRKTYRNHLAAAGKETKTEAREKRRSAIISMQKDGKNAQEIISALAISKATYYREIAIIAAMNNNVLKAVKESVEEKAEIIKNITKKVLGKIEHMIEISKEKLVSKIQPLYYNSIAKQCRTLEEKKYLDVDVVQGEQDVGFGD